MKLHGHDEQLKGPDRGLALPAACALNHRTACCRSFWSFFKLELLYQVMAEQQILLLSLVGTNSASTAG
jgi:hypothetical protein